MVTIPEQWESSKLSMKFRDTAPLLGGYQVWDVETKHQIIDCRVYGSWRGVIKCITWIRAKGREYDFGIGRAGGYGYDKYSSAVSSALRGLGIGMGKADCYCGACSVKQTLEAVAQALGYENTLVAEFYK